MKNYVITVNGTSYEVSVEEVSGAAVEQTVVMPSARPAAPAAAPAAAPKAAPAPAAAPAAPKAAQAAGSISVNSPMPGKIISVKANVGDAVKRGDVILILEAMKMENEIVAPEDGTVASINVSSGDSVEPAQYLLH